MAFIYVNNIANPFIYSLSVAPVRQEMQTAMRAMLARLQALSFNELLHNVGRLLYWYTQNQK